jgi:hypothetical protein
VVEKEGRSSSGSGAERSRVRQSDRRAGMASGGAVEGSSARSRWRRAGEQGRVTGHGRCDAARLTGGAGRQRGPVSATGCGREWGKRGSTVAGHRQVDPASTVPGGAVQTRF